MGFRGTCVIAQSVTDVVCKAAELLQDRRCLPGISCPLELPVWGSILDDVWVIYDEWDPGDLHPERWLGRIDQEWYKVGCRPTPRSPWMAVRTRRSKAVA